MKSPGESSTFAIRHAGPNLLLLTLVYTAFMLAGGSKLVAAFRFPHDSAEKSIAYLAQNAWSIQWGSFCELASAIPLGIFTVTTVSRLRFLGVRAAGESIALLGGIGVTVMLILSALASWSLTRPGIAETTGAVPALQAISFAGGGPGFAVLLGLFIAGVSVTAGLHRLGQPDFWPLTAATGVVRLLQIFRYFAGGVPSCARKASTCCFRAA
jgi:hypothetical protein